MQNKKKNDECPDCNGYGYIITEAGTQICNCQRERLKAERLINANIPSKFMSKSLDNFKAKDKKRKRVVEAARQYITGFNLKKEIQGLRIIGVVGCGKTHIAVAILKEIISKGYTGLYYNVPELLRRLRETYDPQSEEVESEIIDDTTNCDILLLDDLGAELTSGWVRDRLYLIINRRYEQGLPTIITTNCDLDELRERVGERIISRIYEMCPKFEDFPNQDYRKEILEAH